MANEALWTQGTGATFSAAEDRVLIRSMFTDGVVRGLVLSKSGVGRVIGVSAGAAVVGDGGLGAFLAYTDATTSLTIPDNTTQIVYIVVSNPGGAGGGITSVVATSTEPTDPHLVIGTATAAGGSITSTDATMNSRPTALPWNLAAGSATAPVLISGGTMTGPLTVPSLVVNGLATTYGGLDSPVGIKAGTSQFSAKHWGHGTMPAATNAPDNTWKRLTYNTDAAQSSYGVDARPNGTGRFHAGITGDYVVGGWVTFSGQSGGTRHARVAIRNSSDPTGTGGANYWYATEQQTPNNTQITIALSMLIRMSASDYFAVEVFRKNAAGPVDVVGSRCNFRLLQAD